MSGWSTQVTGPDGEPIDHELNSADRSAGSQAALLDLIADDASSFPDGHPCRDCGQLYKDHPVIGVLECRDWR